MTLRPLVLAVLLAVWIAPPAMAAVQDAATPRRTVAVTFDDLPFQSPGGPACDADAILAMTDSLVAMLKPLDTHAVGFVNEGGVCDALRPDVLPAVLSAWRQAGLELGNHTFSHIDLRGATLDAYLADLDRGAVFTGPAMTTTGGRLRYFRHPYLAVGDTRQKHDGLIAGLAARGYVTAPVTLDAEDWMFAGVYRAAEAAGDAALMRRVGEAYLDHVGVALDFFEPYSAALTGDGREPAQIIVLHANSLNRDWYPRVHALFLERGYRFATLETVLADPVYARPETFSDIQSGSWVHRWTAADGRPVQTEPQPPQWIRDAYAAAEASGG